MEKIEKIRKEIERRIALYSRLSEYNIDPNRIDEDEQLLAFIDSLEDKPTDYTNFTQKEVHSQGYDEAYLNDCIAKAKKSWEGVDVDKYMDMVRGREPDKSLEEAAENIYKTPFGTRAEDFIAGAEWQKEQDEKEQADLFTIVALDAAQRAKEQMMKEAVEGEIQMRYSGCLCAKTIRAINEDKFKFGDKVKLIVVKED